MREDLTWPGGRGRDKINVVNLWRGNLNWGNLTEGGEKGDTRSVKSKTKKNKVVINRKFLGQKGHRETKTQTWTPKVETGGGPIANSGTKWNVWKSH